MKIDLPLLDAIPESDLRLLRRSAVKVAARVAEGSLCARDLAQRLEQILSEAADPPVPPRTDYGSPPPVAPGVYKPGQNEKPSEFLVRTYGNWLAAGSLFQPMVRQLDKALMKALDKEFAGRRDELRRLLPTKSDAVTQHLEELVGGTIDADQRKRLIKIGKTVRTAQRQKMAS